MEAFQAREGYELWRPNRAKASSQTMKAVVSLILVISAALMLLVVVGGYERLQGALVTVVAIGWAALYLFFAMLVFNWNRGVLPVAASLAIIMTIFASVAAPSWFARAKDGLASPLLPEELLGLLTLLLIPVQLLLIATAMLAFNQEWHVEEERPIGGYEPPDEDDRLDHAGEPLPTT